MYFDELRLNMSVSAGPVEIKESDMLDFARKYDPIPLHTDEKYAAKSRFGKLIAPGVMAFMSVWAQYTKHDFAGEQFIAGKSTKIEWLHPVFSGDILTGKAVITGLTIRNAYNGIAEITMDVFNQNRQLVLRDVTEAIVARRTSAATTGTEAGHPHS